MHYNTYLAGITTLAIAPSALATVTVFNNRDAWLNAVGEHTFIGFTEFREFTIITDQYSELGVIFTDRDDFIFTSGGIPFDGAALVGSNAAIPGTIRMAFDDPHYAIAFNQRDHVQVDLFLNDSLVYSSAIHAGSFFPFIGFISNTPFNRVDTYDPVGQVLILDDLYFGAPIPSSGSLAAIMVSMILGGSRRQRAVRV